MADLVSGYNVIAKLGDGARSQVYQVVKPETGRTFALKRVLRDAHEDCRFLEQAIKEYEVSSRFTHAYLRKSFELKRIRKMLRLVEVQVVMEYVDGVSLDKNRPERLDDTVDIFIKVAEGLDAMHDLELLHTDIKPNNILLMKDGAIKIIDYGQSCPIGFRKPRIQGTPDYIAPEQVERRHLTKATDVFNLGATLYWALTGETYPTMITKKGRQGDQGPSLRKPIPAPQELNPEIPAALSKLVMCSCAHEQGKRPRDMKEVIEQLERIRHVLAKRAKAGHDMSTTVKPHAETPPDLDLEDEDSEDSYDFSGFIREVLDEESRDKQEPKGE